MPIPQTAAQAIEILGQENIIDKEFAEKFKEAVKFRNILVHDYIRLDYELISKYLKEDISDFDRFSKEILEYLK